MSENIVAVRSIEIVTAEIHTIRDNVARVFMDGVVQIGRRLEEAKQMVPQGQWQDYLQNDLGYKPSTAQNYMRIAREFGNGQVSLSGKTAQDVFGQLGYSQLLPLLGMPEEEREQLAEEHDLADMSSRDIAALVKERDEAKEAAILVAAEIDGAHAAAKQAEAAAEKAKAEAQDLKDKLQSAKEKAKAEKDAAEAAQKQVAELEAKAAEPAELSEEDMQRLREEVAAEQAQAIKDAEKRAADAAAKLERVKNPAAHKVNFLFGEVQALVARLREALDELDTQDAETAAKMRGAIGNAMEGWKI